MDACTKYTKSSKNQQVGGLLQRKRSKTIATKHTRVVRAHNYIERRYIFLSAAPHMHELRAVGGNDANGLYVRTQRTSMYKT